MKRHLCLLLVARAVLFAACKSDSGQTGAPADLLAPSGDLGTPPDAATGAPVEVLPGSYLLDGITTDAWLVFHDSHAYYVADTAGANLKATKLVEYNAKGPYASDVRGRVVFISPNLDASGIGPLVVWSSTAPAPSTVSMAASVFARDANGDGSTVAYSTNVDAARMTGDFVLDDIAHTAPRTIASQANVLQCPFKSAFSGARFLLSYCPGGAVDQALVSFHVPTGKATTLLPSTNANWQIDDAGTNVIATNSQFQGVLIPLSGGPAVQLVPQDFGEGFFTAGGDAVIYKTVFGRHLERVDVTGKNRRILQPNDVYTIYGASPDRKWTVFAANLDQKTSFHDLFLASVEDSRPPVTVTAMTNADLSHGPAFTDDSNYVITGVDAAADVPVPTAILTQPTAGGSGRKFGSGRIYKWADAGGAKIVFEDNQHIVQRRFIADIHLVDLVRGDAPTLLQANAFAEVVVAPDKKRIFFSTDKGIFAAEVH